MITGCNSSSIIAVFIPPSSAHVLPALCSTDLHSSHSALAVTAACRSTESFCALSLSNNCLLRHQHLLGEESLSGCHGLQSVRERIEDKRKAVLGAMSPSPAVDFSSQRSAQRAFPHSSPFSDQPQGRPLQRGSPSFSPYSELGSLRMTPVASSPGQGMYDELAEGAAGNADRDNQQQQPQQPQQEQTSLADRLRTSLTSGHGELSSFAQTAEHTVTYCLMEPILTPGSLYSSGLLCWSLCLAQC